MYMYKYIKYIYYKIYIARLLTTVLWRKAKFILEQMCDCMISLAEQSKAQKKPIIPHVVKLL